MLGNASGIVSLARRRHKRRRRSRTDEKRPTKKKERSEKTATYSETSQATYFTQGSLSVEKESDENRPPLMNCGQNSLQQGMPPLTNECSSFSFSARESNTEGMPINMEIQRNERIHGSLVQENLSVGDSLSMDSTLGEALDHHEGMEISNYPQTTFVSDAWSTDQHRTSWSGMQEVESTPPDKLCEELRRSLSLFSQTENEDKEQLFSEDKKHLSDNLDDTASLPDDGLDAFADEEWHLEGEYVPSPYPVGLDWEE